MELTEVKQAIQKWESIKNSADQVTAYLKSGSYVILNRQQFEVWNTLNPTELHVYMGIFEEEFKFILIDNESSKDIVSNLDHLFVQPYLAGIEPTDSGFIDNAVDGGITVLEALKRITLWNRNLDAWVKQQVSSEPGIFSAFVVPFSNLKSHFAQAGAEESMLVFGLNQNAADLMLWGLNTGVKASQDQATFTATAASTFEDNSSLPVEDFSCPVPPYRNSDMCLL